MSAHSRQMNSTTKSAARDASANADPSQGISLCIPRVFNNIGWRRIKQVFIDLRWGFVERVDVIKLGKNKRAFVHFAPGKWNTRDQQAVDALAALVSQLTLLSLVLALRPLSAVRRSLICLPPRQRRRYLPATSWRMVR